MLIASRAVMPLMLCLSWAEDKEEGSQRRRVPDAGEDRGRKWSQLELVLATLTANN